MVLIAGCLGLRASEIVGLQWRDFDFEKSTLLVQRGVVHGRVDDVKTEYSRDVVPIAPELAKEMLAYRERLLPTPEGWLFANPATEKPYHQEEIQKKHIRKAAKAAGIIPRSAGRRSGTATAHGWTKRSADWSPTGVDAPRQHSNHDECVWRAMTDSKRQAHSNVVQMVLQSSESKETAEPENGEPRLNVV